MTLNVSLPPGDPQALVSEVLGDFLADCRMRNLSARTVEWYSDTLCRLLGPLLDLPLASVGLAEIRASLSRLLDGRSPATVNGFVRAVKAFLNWATKEEFLVRADPRRIARLKEPQRIPPTLTVEQIKAILSAPKRNTFLGLRDHTCMALMLDTGVRLGEVRGLLATDVSIPFAKVRGKGDKERTVALSPPMQSHMRRYLRARQVALTQADVETPYLFPSRMGAQLSAKRVHELVVGYARKAGLEGLRVSPHVFRYTFATHFLRNGGSIVALQQILGHTTLAMSRRYAAIFDADVWESSMALSPLVGLRL